MCLGIPGQVIEIIDREEKRGMVNVGGVRREVNLTCVADLPLDQLVGQWVLVHVGFAMSRIDEAEAARTLDLLREMGEVQAQIREMQNTKAGAS